MFIKKCGGKTADAKNKVTRGRIVRGKAIRGKDIRNKVIRGRTADIKKHKQQNEKLLKNVKNYLDITY